MVSPCPLIDNLPTGDGHLIGACLQPAVPYSPCNGNLVKHTFDEEESATVNYKWLEALNMCSQVEEGNWKDRVLCSSDLCNCVTSAQECNGDTLQVCGATVQRCQSAAQQCNSEGGWPSSHATATLYSLSQAFSNHTLIIVIINFSMYIPSFKWKDWIKLSEWTFPSKSRFIRIFCLKFVQTFSHIFRIIPFFFGAFSERRLYHLPTI